MWQRSICVRGEGGDKRERQREGETTSSVSFVVERMRPGVNRTMLLHYTLSPRDRCFGLCMEKNAKIDKIQIRSPVKCLALASNDAITVDFGRKYQAAEYFQTESITICVDAFP